MPNYVVLFNRNNACILKNIEDVEPYYNMSNALVNPSLHEVQKVHSIYWTMRASKLTVLRGANRRLRLRNVMKTGTEMRWEPEYRLPVSFYITCALVIGIIVYAKILPLYL